MSLEQLHDLVATRSETEIQIKGNIRALRADGTSWRQIGESLGVSAQAAWHRYRDG